jgi:glycosyltransferase involved in cell wall biosynthesis
VLVTGSFDAAAPRNAHALGALRLAGVELVEDPREADAVWVGHPGRRSLPSARAAARSRPVILAALDELAADLGLAARQLLRLADLVVTETEASAEALAGRSGLARERFAACFLGTDEGVFAPPWTPAVPFTCLSLGDGEPELLAAAGRAPEIVFRLAGGAPRRSHPANVEIAGRVEPALLGHEVRRAGCVVVLTREDRVIPPGAFAALACGTPLVAADTPALRELVADGDTALLVPPGNARALATAVARVNTDFELGRALSARGLERFRAAASREALARSWRGLLERQIGTASRRR